MEKVDVYMNFFVSDYLTDTADLSVEEHGAYSLLLFHMWAQGGSLPAEHARLARLARVPDPAAWSAIWEVIAPKFMPADPGRITQKRLKAELEKARKRKTDAVSNGRKGGLTAAGKPVPDEPPASHPTSDPGSHPASEKAATLPAAGQRPSEEDGGDPGSEKAPLQSPISNLQSPSETPTPSPSQQTQIFVGLTPDGDGSGPEVSGEVQKVRAVFGHYRTYHPKSFPAPKADSKEAKLIRARLRDGYSVEALKEAIDGYHRNPYHCGENKQGQKYQSLELIVRDADHVASGIEYAGQRAGPVRSEREIKSVRAGLSWAQREKAGTQGGDHDRR